jgi:flagellar hook-associated protein 1 FlgK
VAVNFLGMDTALSGLAANQKALEVTGHNVANLATAGYSRQSVVMASAATRAYGGNNWKIEMGVSIQQIRQIRHMFTDNIYRSESNALGYWEARSKAVRDVQAILGEPMTAGFQNSLNIFWDAWQELSKAPESLTIRALLKQRAEALAENMNHIGTQLNKLQSDLNNEIKARIDEVNEITAKIAELNVKIMSAEAAGNSPNDYYDERNMLVDRLSTLLTVETWIGMEGNMDIIVDGYFLVSKGIQTRIYAAPNQDLSYFYTPKVEGIDVEIDVGQGVIKGLLEARGEVSGAKGSYDNGTPNTTADLTIVVDAANTTEAYRLQIRDHIRQMAEDLGKRGIDYNLRLVVIGSGALLESVSFGKDIDSLVADIPTSGTFTETTYDFGQIVSEVASKSGREANKYLLMFTGESINGSGSTATDPMISGYISTLNEHGITLSVATEPDYYSAGDPGEHGWAFITGHTRGKVYDIGSADYANLMMSISRDINDDVNRKISTIPEDLNIISSVRKQLNALLNIMAREVNYIHQMGKTLTGLDGGLFFAPIDPGLPLEMGNLAISSDLKDLNNIAASTTDANGDNTIALRIAGLRNANLMTGGKKILSLDTYYQNIILDIGNKGYEADNMAVSHRLLVGQSDHIRQTVMGVSLDEEIANMIRFKYAYNANSKLIGVINSMIETVIFRLGISGR